jgi:hypothetical protein
MRAIARSRTNDDSPRNVEETRQYIRDFIRLNDATKTALELYDKMLELYPDRANPGSLFGVRPLPPRLSRNHGERLPPALFKVTNGWMLSPGRTSLLPRP